jgi:hypothetical protein
MEKLVSAVPNVEGVGWDIRFRKFWTRFYLGLLVATALLFVHVFGPWLVLELWEEWTGMSLSMSP